MSANRLTNGKHLLITLINHPILKRFSRASKLNDVWHSTAAPAWKTSQKPDFLSVPGELLRARSVRVFERWRRRCVNLRRRWLQKHPREMKFMFWNVSMRRTVATTCWELPADCLASDFPLSFFFSFLSPTIFKDSFFCVFRFPVCLHGPRDDTYLCCVFFVVAEIL